mmetsp:Transcript_52905/g.133665  ORF Transcript_52905/g.133665 Transcript_52905/m.133665 type:complete len:396 (+) Transcript_52905:82-1269(+)
MAAADLSHGALSAPPVSGLGNFKGVMLCNRPSDEPAAKLNGGGDGPAPFKSMIAATHGEQLGLPPCKSTEPSAGGVKKRGPSAALRQHVRWLRELEDQMRGERDQVEEEERQNEERKHRMRAAAERHREGVRAMMAERDAGMDSGAKPASAPAVPRGDATRKSKPAKPLWAMTEKEKENFEDDEGDDLIAFAEQLDFDKYVGDLEFRQGVEALKDRAGKLQKEQEAFKDALVADFNAMVDDDEGKSTSVGSPRSLKLDDGIDGQSLLDAKSEYSTASRRSRGEARYRDRQLDWDASTSCGDDRPQVDQEVKDVASAVMESAPQIRQIHSKESVQRIIEKAREKQSGGTTEDLIESMRRSGPTPAPVITSSEDTQQRLHKPVDPSQLPYLYRSPAI